MAMKMQLMATREQEAKVAAPLWARDCQQNKDSGVFFQGTNRKVGNTFL